MGASASMVKARLQAEYGDEMSTWEWSDEMRDAAIESITKTYESVLATTASPEGALTSRASPSLERKHSTKAVQK